MTTPWWKSPLCPFDLESTGVNSKRDRIVTGYVGVLLPAEPRWTVRVDAQVMIDPGVPIPEGATKIHGITDAIAKERGCVPRDGVYALVKALGDALKARIPVVGFNLPYDLTMLHHECLRHDVPTLAELVGGEPAPVLDAHVLDKATDPYRKGSRRLDATCEHHRVALDGAHDAAQDALAAARVLYRLALRYPKEIGDVSPSVLHDRQIAWRRQQAASLRDYLRRGNPAATVDPCWPVCVDPTHTTT